MIFHSPGVTGVIERRFPLRRTTMPSRSARSRISSSETRRVFLTNSTSTSIQRGVSRVAFGSK